MRIHSISVSGSRGVRKENIQEAVLREGYGIVNDAHAGNWHRQVSLLAVESIQKMTTGGIEVGPGDFAENITTEGIDLLSLSIGQKLRLGEMTLIEITQKGKECRDRCRIHELAGDCVMPREGVFARVLVGGVIRPGDPISMVRDGGNP